MIIGTETTQILLEKGSEDLALISEIHKIMTMHEIKGIRYFAKHYPKINELRQMLEADNRED